MKKKENSNSKRNSQNYEKENSNRLEKSKKKIPVDLKFQNFCFFFKFIKIPNCKEQFFTTKKMRKWKNFARGKKRNWIREREEIVGGFSGKRWDLLVRNEKWNVNDKKWLEWDYCDTLGRGV